ncbi:MAG: DUF4265 domain-containing protein [Planctomycetes bacterium]|nr:DUF4265 domain-containing protein [Planctomycetota bacterium]
MHLPSAKNLVSIDVPLVQDADGYPPMTVEPMWAATTSDGLYEIRSIPFFATAMAKLDLVIAEEEAGQLTFKRTIKPSGRSVLRIVFRHTDRITQTLLDLERMGCHREFYAPEKIYAFDVPLASDLRAVVTYLSTGDEHDWWYLEHACVGR